LIPYNINGREGHNSLPNAENRAISAAEDKIAKEYSEKLNDYLSQMIPKR
jgi:hypothetical protein